MGQSLEASMDKELHQNTSQTEKTGFLARVVHLTWSILGNVLLFIILILIIVKSQETGSALDITFWFVVAGLILIRFIDIKVFQGHTAGKESATLKDWFRYSVGLILMSGFFWVVAHAIIKRMH
jgi:hypothetical protein